MWKKVALWVAVVLVLLAGAGYLVLKYYTGDIPRYVYETVAPELSEFKRPTILVFNKTNGFIHRDALPASEAMLRDLADQLGWDVVVTNNAAIHNLRDLQRFEMVVWNNTSGDVLTEDQRAAFKTWLEQGGGWVGLHASGGDPSYRWDWYVDVLIGAQFIGHTMEPQFQDADVYTTEKNGPLTSHLSNPWRIRQEEWYAFDQNPRDKGYQILLTVDESSYVTVGETLFGMIDSMPGEHPLVWQHRVGKGRVFYSAIGHAASTYSVPEYRELIKRAMAWSAE